MVLTRQQEKAMFANLGITKKINFFHDPSHGYYQIPKATLVKLDIQNDISPSSKREDTDVFLEEDRDMSLFVNALKLKGLKLEEDDFNDKHFDEPNQNPANLDFGLCDRCGRSFSDIDKLKLHQKIEARFDK